MLRILLVTASFAPRSSSPAVRPVHLVKYWHRAGHQVRVITYCNRQQTLDGQPDLSLAAKVPANVTTVRVEPGWVHRLLARSKSRGVAPRTLKQRAVRHPLSALFIPDPHVPARRAFVKTALDQVVSWRPDVLMTSAYPFTMTLVGSDVCRRCPGLIWLADYGDPWTGSPVSELRLPRWRRWLDRRLEAQALNSADAIIMTTEPAARLYRDQFPALADRIHVVTMGYDPDDSASIMAAPRSATEVGKVVLLHAGRLYLEARDPRPFLAAVEACQATDPNLGRRLSIALLGEVAASIRNAIAGSPASALFDLRGWVSVSESIAQMKAADALLLFGNRGALQIPGKVYQYIGTNRPVFMICEDERDPTVDVIRHYGRGLIVPNRVPDLTEALRSVLAGARPLSDKAAAVGAYAWPALAGRIAAIAAAARTNAADSNTGVCR